jgi:hypothetical protein
MLNRIIAKIAVAAACAGLSVMPAAAQDAPGWDVPAGQQAPAPAAPEETQPATANEWVPVEQAVPADPPPATPGETGNTTANATTNATAAADAGATIPRRDIFAAASDLFGDGAEGLAGLLERILGDQGEPIAYISGQEASGAFVFGLRYGSGVMRHRIEGDRNVYWRGPSLGFDFGADASKVFVLVYNLHDSQRLFRRYPGAEGNAYVVGGFTASYLRRGDVVLIPVRLGVGMRLGVNAGYMRFSERNRWVPF